MKFITRNRPSAAMIVAVLAVSLGLGGSAVAASGVLTKKQVKQVKRISDKQITKRAPGLAVASAKRADTAARADTAKSADTATRAGTATRADSATSADTAGRATNVYAANVNADGALLGSVPAGATSERISAGIYRVTLTRPVTGCLISSAFGSNDGAINPGSTGVIPVTNENPNRVAVATFNNAGATEDRDFYVQMVCP
jgi:hypothetical protein